jgi:hypothetical protein
MVAWPGPALVEGELAEGDILDYLEATVSQ